MVTLDLSSTATCFLWGPRQTGKTTLLRQLFPSAPRYDLLLADEYRRLIQDPSLIRQECRARGLTGATQTDPIIIDEIQKIPALLDEVHWLIENAGLRFVLCGSSARKLRRQHGNLLGGRAVRYELFPFVYPELDDFELERALNHGLVPRHYLADSPRPLLEAYAGDYLREEITAEALTRNVPAFSRFLEVAALGNGEVVSFSNIARECGVSGPTIKQYYQILVDTLIAFEVPSYRRRAKRRVVAASRFYFFDVGIVAQLSRRGVVQPGSELFGRLAADMQQIGLWSLPLGLMALVLGWAVIRLVHVRLRNEDIDVRTEKALEVASANPGHLDGQPFDWIADADSRLGPLMELILGGNYYWVPFLRIHRLEIDLPRNLQERVWIGAAITWTNGGHAQGYVPVRYPNTEDSSDGALLMAEAVEWVDLGHGLVRGVGQRVLCTEGGDWPLLRLRRIDMDEMVN